MSLKRFYYLGFFILLNVKALSQTSSYATLQRVIPATPEAVSLGQVGFSDVSLYTGKVNYSIPIYSISQNGINFPISLSYTGGGGIKVEEVASSAGLGWNLSSTGVVSRVIRGVADDTYAGDYIGYIHLPDFPSTSDMGNYNTYANYYAKNKYDGQPDLFSVSVTGMAAQFYIAKNKKVVFIEKSDLKITPIFTGYAITAFEVRDLSGRIYYFSEKEESKSIPVDGSQVEYNLYNTSSWYLTKITSEFNKDVIIFTYLSGESNQLQQEIRSPYQYGIGEVFFGESNTSFSQIYYKRPLLQKISFAVGEVTFVMASSNRYDLAGDKSVNSVIVKNYLNNTIKQFNFYYSYFSLTGTIQQGQGNHYAFGDPTLRLKLDSLKEVSATSETHTYRFEYNTSQYLPDRMNSFAMDHWGFYNGKSANTGWEAKNRVKYYTKNFSMGGVDSFYREFGSADRKPDILYAKAGVLEKVKTPTGGEINFEYELNSSADTKLPNQLVNSNMVYTLDLTPTYFNISLVNEPYASVTVKALVQQSSYSIEYFIYDNTLTRLYYKDTLVLGDALHRINLETGNYAIKARLIGSHSDPEFNYGSILILENEQVITNKPVGGLRIKSMNLAETSANIKLSRNYFYNESGDTSSSSLSTGEISGIPAYGFQNVGLFTATYSPDYFSAAGAYFWPTGYVRQISSFYPLGSTAGSFVGYGKVTVIDSNTLRSESYFTGFKDFPELADGYRSFPLNDDDGTFINGKWSELHPLAPYDERDYLRGKLKKEVIYKKENGVYQKVKQVENTYEFNMGFPVTNHEIMLPDTMEYMHGMIFTKEPNASDPNSPIIKFKNYNLYTGKYDMKKTVEKSYSYQGGQDSIVNETTFEYGDSPWFRDSVFHYQPSKITKSTSTGSNISKIYYPYNWRYNIPDASIPETNNMIILEQENRIGSPVLQTEENLSAVHISSVKYEYATLAGSKLAMNLIKTKQGSQSSFEQRVSFNQYDNDGNLLSQQKTNDILNSYIWDYLKSYPVAEYTGADSTNTAYTSFEADGKGYWTFSGTAIDDATAPTGKMIYSFNGSNNISRSGLNSSATYIVSYWTKNASAFSIAGTQSGYPVQGRSLNGWNFFTHKITGQTQLTIGSSGLIDELRLHPYNALMTTMTYDPLIGMTSQCDANNRITYYEYDAFSRLKLIRDQDGNIIKTIEYHYKQQQN